jgi:hypothetical protein
MTDSNLSLLTDRVAISDVVYAYATGLDRRDWELFRSIFTDSIKMEFESAGIRPGTYAADDWVRSAQRLFAGFSATQHTSTNHVHDIRGDRATCTSNMQAEHFVAPDAENGLQEGEERFTLGGYYVNELVRQPEGWKLCEVTLNVTWRAGNPKIPSLAAKLGRSRETGH